MANIFTLENVSDFSEKINIDELYEKLKVYKYDFINFNCEHFVNFAKNNDYVSPQVLRWTSLIGIGIITFYLLRKKI